MPENHAKDTLVIYTDGACSPNPGPGGWGAVIIANGQIRTELSGFEEDSTNNRMELTAAVSVLESLDKPATIVLYTDSIYLKNGITEWIVKWQANNWRTADRKEVKNSDLWHRLLRETGRHQVDWRWVKGHGHDRFNIRADELAVQARKTRKAHTTTPGEKRLSANHIHLFTGVTCRHAAGVGGWSVILNWRTHVRTIGAGVTGLTANQLYLEAVINGLRTLKKELPVEVHTHSGYLYDGATSWLTGWKQRNWRTREGEEVSNKSRWEELDQLMTRFQVTFHLEGKENTFCFLQEAKELAREFERELSCQ